MSTEQGGRPELPAGYMTVKIDGQNALIPYYGRSEA